MLGIVGVAVVGVAGFALYMASTIAHPQGNDLKAERQWEIDHGLWGDFDLLPQSEYQVKGYDGYELHCSFVPAEHTSNKCVIISHGFRSNRYGAVKYVASYRKLGFNCIILACASCVNRWRPAADCGWWTWLLSRMGQTCSADVAGRCD